MRRYYDVILLTPTLSEAARRRLLPHSAGQRDHLGLGYIASSIKAMGGRVLLLDCLAAKLTARDLAETLAAATFSLAGIYTYQECADDIRLSSRVLKSVCPDAHVVLGGPGATIAPAYWLESYETIDGIMLGDGEAAVPGFLEVAGARRALADVPGMCTREGGSPPAKHVPLDELPWPERPSLDEGAEECSIVTARGCPFRCTFCSVPEVTRRGALPRYRSRTPESVISEVDYLVRGRGVKYISFVDDLFFGLGRPGLERCRELITGIDRTGMHLQFGITCRTADVEADLFSHLRHVGLRTVYLGVESLLDVDLAHFSKGNSATTNLKAIRICRSLGLRFHIGFIMLYPNVTFDRVEANVRALYRHGLWEYALTHRLLSRRMYIFRNTPAARRYGEAAIGWDYAYSDPCINAYLELARRLENQAFFLLLRPSELKRARRKERAGFEPYNGARPSSRLPKSVVAQSYETLDQWFRTMHDGADSVTPLCEVPSR